MVIEGGNGWWNSPSMIVSGYMLGLGRGHGNWRVLSLMITNICCIDRKNLRFGTVEEGVVRRQELLLAAHTIDG